MSVPHKRVGMKGQGVASSQKASDFMNLEFSAAGKKVKISFQ
jgi:hypothetical protein